MNDIVNSLIEEKCQLKKDNNRLILLCKSLMKENAKLKK